MAAVGGAWFTIAVVVNYLQGDDTWLGLAVAAVVASISLACTTSLLRERRRATESRRDIDRL